jgi:RimJ/RimL family protein N-acetyltransferase
VTLAEAKLKSDADWASEAVGWSSGTSGSTFFAERENQVVGMAGAHLAGHECELVAVWTAPEARNAGVSRRIVGAIEAWARQCAATELRTAVAEGNQTAATVYERLGFKPTGLQRPIGSDGSRNEWRYKRDLQQ